MKWARQRPEWLAGWLFAAPAVAGIGLFLLVPVVLAFWASFRDWNGIGPLGESHSVGTANYEALLVSDGLPRSDFAVALRNNLYYVLGVVPLQTALAFGLALVLNQRYPRLRGFFRAAYYFPSVTSSIAISLIFIFLFQTNGIVNAVASGVFGAEPVNWLENADGVLHLGLGALGLDLEQPPTWLTGTTVLGLPLWDWLSGPSVTLLSIMLLAVWTTSGMFMVIFLAGLQNIPEAVEEAAVVDGAGPWRRLWSVTIPMMRPTLALVLTLGVTGTWQVFDQVYAISAGGPQRTTLTPAYLIFRDGFRNFSMGRASAIAFVLLVVIVASTLVSRWLLNRKERA